jgi:DNA-binding transcriptional regulator YhcF (GntR family)
MKGLCCKETFPFKRKAAAEMGVSPDATYDALTNLEAAGLIQVDRHRGRSPVVTVLDD